MLFSLLKSKKGVTFVEIMTVVIVIGILSAVSVPLLTGLAKRKKIEDCANQRILIATAVEQGLSGMIDNGKKQPKIYFQKVQADHKTKYTGDGVTGNADDSYVNQECFVLIEDQGIPGKIAFSLGDLRGGYGIGQRNSRNELIMDYTEACDYGYYLKKKKLADNKFYKYLANEEIPVCPFVDKEDKKTDNDDYHYYIFWNETKKCVEVVCSCPDCHEVD